MPICSSALRWFDDIHRRVSERIHVSALAEFGTGNRKHLLGKSW